MCLVMNWFNFGGQRWHHKTEFWPFYPISQDHLMGILCQILAKTFSWGDLCSVLVLFWMQKHHRGNFITSGTNVHLDWRLNWLEFGGQRSLWSNETCSLVVRLQYNKVAVPSENYDFSCFSQVQTVIKTVPHRDTILQNHNKSGWGSCEHVFDNLVHWWRQTTFFLILCTHLEEREVTAKKLLSICQSSECYSIHWCRY